MGKTVCCGAVIASVFMVCERMSCACVSAVPSANVATVSACASVIEGVSRCRNALLNGDTHNYDLDSGYTCHQLGSGDIIIQLAQPYIIKLAQVCVCGVWL